MKVKILSTDTTTGNIRLERLIPKVIKHFDFDLVVDNKHLSVKWVDLLQEWTGEQPLLIMEDDAVITEDFNKETIKELITEAKSHSVDLLSLGSPSLSNRDELKGNLILLKDFMLTHCVVLLPTFKDKFIRPSKEVHIDLYINKLPNIRKATVYPFWVIQDSLGGSQCRHNSLNKGIKLFEENSKIIEKRFKL